MEVKCRVLLYLDKRHLLEEIQVECSKFLKHLSENPMQKFLPFRYLLEIDAMKLLDEFPDLGKLLLDEPMVWQRTVSDILFYCLQSMIHDYDSQVLPAQAAVTIRLKCIPKMLRRPNQYYYNGVVSFEGLLIAISKPSTYVYHTVWCCPEECDDSLEILHYIPEISPKCKVCKSVLFENSGMRRCGEKVNITFMLKQDYLTRNFVIVDDLIPKLREGIRFLLAGVVHKKTTTIWQVEEVNNMAAPLTSPVPTEIKELLRKCNGLPWKFIYCLASSIGVNVCPLNCFMHLKISLLLSLSSIKSNILTGSSILHVLAAGLDGSHVGNIMSEAAKLAERSVIIENSNTTVSTALLASSGGVCVMPLPLLAYSQKTTFAVFSAVESGEISTDNVKVKLLSTVWAQGMNCRKFDVASVFGFVCRGDCGEYDEEIADFLLENAVEPLSTSKDEVRALKDVSHYIDLVAGLNVALGVSTEKLLRSYFLAARKERPRGLSVGSMGALVAATITSARLCRRSIATVDDAVFTIWLHVSGSPEPRFAPEEYLQTPADIKQFHKIINDFKEWLEQFIGGVISIL